MTMPQPRFPSRRSAATALGAVSLALIVAGCTDGEPQSMRANPTPAEQVVTAQPAPATPAATATRKPGKTKAAQTMTRRPPEAPARTNLDLNVSYMVRILVPAGSELSLRAQGAGDAPPALKTVKIESGPPYSVSLPVQSGAAAYPMEVTATLTSTIGHVLSGAITLSAPPTGPVEITMSPQS